jgi:hypothetical protein
MVFVKVAHPALQVITWDAGFTVLEGAMVLWPIAKVWDVEHDVAGSVILTV